MSQVWEVYSKNNEYSISFPSSWSLDDSGSNGTSVIISSEPESLTDIFYENVNVLVQDLSGQNIDMLKYLEISKDQLKNMRAKNVNFTRNYYPSDGIPETVLEYSFRSGNLNIRCKQRVKLKDEKAYVITFLATNETYAKYSKVGNRILESFSFERRNSINDDLLFKDLKHKLSMDLLPDFEDLELDGNYILHQGNLSDQNKRLYSLKYNDKWGFRHSSIDEYLKEMNRDKSLKLLSELYEDVSINVYEKSIAKNLNGSKIFHMVYSRNDLESRGRTTVSMFQFIKNSKFYTFNCQCKSTYFQYFYQDCLKLFESIRFQ